MHNLQTVYGGAAVALALGLLLGGALHPNLDGDDRPAGPQIILGKAALRSTGPFDPGPAYVGKVPDYVLGTDWKKAAGWQEPPAAVAPPARRIVREDDPTPTVVFTRADFDAAPPPRPRYPTLGDAPAPVRAPVGQAIDDADEAPDSAG